MILPFFVMLSITGAWPGLAGPCAKRATPHAAASGDKLVDNYLFHYMLGQTLQPADITELRNLARLMVDSKLSDTKKKILMLQYSGLNQSEIAEQLLSNVLLGASRCQTPNH